MPSLDRCSPALGVNRNRALGLRQKLGGAHQSSGNARPVPTILAIKLSRGEVMVRSVFGSNENRVNVVHASVVIAEGQLGGGSRFQS